MTIILHFKFQFYNNIIIIIIVSDVLSYVAIIVSSRTGWFRDPIFLSKVSTVDVSSNFGTPHPQLSEGAMNFLDIFRDRGISASKVNRAARNGGQFYKSAVSYRSVWGRGDKYNEEKKNN
jgi:hypothetical protein